MEDLRSEIRAAFEKEQAGYAAPPANLRHDVVRAAARQPRREMNLQWLAVAATVLIGVLVVVSLMSSRVAQRPAPSGTPHPVPSGDYGTPPAGVPLIYVGDPHHPGWYIGFDWTTDPRGTIKLAEPPPETSKLVQAPNGAGFFVQGFKGTAGEDLDRLGHPVGPVDSGVTQAWSDDSTELCVLTYATPDWKIGVAPPGQTPHSVSTVRLDPAIVRSGVIAVSIASCSARNDRAVLVRSAFGYEIYEWVVRLSDGAILAERRFAPNLLASITASPDGSLIAESSNRSNGYIAGGTAPNTIVRRAIDGAVVATLDPSLQVLAFSGDGRWALVATTPWAAGVPTHVGEVDIATGTLVSSLNTESELEGFLVQPGGSRFAFFLKDPTDQSLHPSITVYISTQGAGDGPVRGGFLPNFYVAP